MDNISYVCMLHTLHVSLEHVIGMFRLCVCTIILWVTMKYYLVFFKQKMAIFVSLLLCFLRNYGRQNLWKLSCFGKLKKIIPFKIYKNKTSIILNGYCLEGVQYWTSLNGIVQFEWNLIRSVSKWNDVLEFY